MNEDVYKRFAVIKGHPNYAVNPFGEVVSVRYGRMLKQDYSSQGFAKVKIDNEKLYVHKLVAETFIPNPDCKKYVSHKNGDIQDNFYMNLVWTNNYIPHKTRT